MSTEVDYDLDYAIRVDQWCKNRKYWVDEYHSLLCWTVPISCMENKHLDIGCNLGHSLAVTKRLMNRVNSIGVEVNKSAINYAKIHFPDRTIMEPQDVIFNTSNRGKFNMITMVHTLSHIDFWESYLEAVVQLLAPGGRLGIIIPNEWHYRLMRPIHWGQGYTSDRTIKHGITPGKLRAVLKALGLKPVIEYQTGRRVSYLSWPERLRDWAPKERYTIVVVKE